MTTELDDQLRTLGSILIDFAPPVTLDELRPPDVRQTEGDDKEFNDAPLIEFLNATSVHRQPHRRDRYLGVAALIGLAAGLVAVVALRDPVPPSVDGVGSPMSSSPVPSSSAASVTSPPPAVSAVETGQPGDTESTINTTPTGIDPAATINGAATAALACDDYGCHGFDDLPVVAGASDFYAGPESLGEPTIHLDKFENLTRCAVLTPDYSACAELEGIAGVSLVEYPGISVGTTFAHVTPQDYADHWGATGAGPATFSDTTVRGHPAVRYDYSDVQTVVWEERPGVLVWVEVLAGQESELLSTAEGIRLLSGPTTIPHRVVHGDTSSDPNVVRYNADDNDGDGMVIGRVGEIECVGFGYIGDSCSQGIAASTVSRMRDGTINIAGATPPNVASVVLTFSSGMSAEFAAEPFADYHSLFYSFAYVPDPGVDPSSVSLIRVDWLDANGEVIDRFDWATQSAGVPESSGVSTTA